MENKAEFSEGLCFITQVLQLFSQEGNSQLYSKRASNGIRQKENGESIQFFIENIKGKIPTWRQSYRNLNVF